MALFRRKKDRTDDDVAGEASGPDTADGAPDEPAEVVAGDGPWDAGSAPDDGLQRLDLGSLLVPGFPGMELRLEVDRATDRVIAVTAVSGESQLQMQGFAAPRSGGIWDSVRAEIMASIAESNGTAEEVDGRFGREILAQVPAEASQGLQPARFVGADGRRWFLRGVFSNVGTSSEDVVSRLEDVFAGTVVVRGDAAMAPRDLLPLHLPDPAAHAGDQPSQWASMDPLRRGPEITEIH